MPSRVRCGRRAAVEFVVCFGWGGFFRVFFSRMFFFFERTRPAASMRPPFASFTSLILLSNEARPKERGDRGRLLLLRRKSLFIMRQGRGSEATEDVFGLQCKKASSYRGAYRVPLFNLSVGMCVCVCVTLNSFLLIATAVRGRFPQTRCLWKRASMA